MNAAARSAALSIALDLSEWEEKWDARDAALTARHIARMNGLDAREALDLGYAIASMIGLERGYEWVLCVASAAGLEYVPAVPGLLLPEEGD